jgi:hypothetical protein
MKTFIRITASVALLSLAGCAQDQERPAEDTSGAATTTPYAEPAPSTTEVTTSAAAMPNVRTIYFAFDSSELGGDGRQLRS